MKDLFGKEITAYDFQTVRSPYQKFKKLNNYRPTESKDYCCKTCKNLQVHHMNKSYYKCKLTGDSCSSATDIRISYVCKKWES